MDELQMKFLNKVIDDYTRYQANELATHTKERLFDYAYVYIYAQSLRHKLEIAIYLHTDDIAKYFTKEQMLYLTRYKSNIVSKYVSVCVANKNLVDNSDYKSVLFALSLIVDKLMKKEEI